MKYIYTAEFTPIEDASGYYARVPDLPGCITTGKDLADAIDQITDAASIWLVTAEDDSLQIPSPSDQNSLNKEPETVFSVIQVDTLEYRALIDDHAVRKNVSLPAWMSKLADKNHINCSKVLQDGLLAEFKKIRA
ncbi:MAG: type II toxin-antitoxin system HicB family antitoxin [Firmicutes bacterium]|nr:type II toxin-antitoxin system HicB family antitoxin [Bacillota bacterium]